MARPSVISGSAYVIDGDTIVINKKHIRLFGMDAFESRQTCGKFRCGVEATQVMRDLVRGQNVRCVQQDIDPYGRTVAICKLPSGVDVGGEMVRRGLAVAYRTYSRRYMQEEAYAKAHKLGAWAHGFQSPQQYRRTHR